MGVLIKLQGFKEWKNGLLTTERLLKGETFFPENMTFDYDSTITNEIAQDIDILSQNIDWSKMSHHEHCCCNDCAPTEEDRDRIAKDFYKCGDDCICIECVNRRMKEQYHEHHHLAPSDCEE